MPPWHSVRAAFSLFGARPGLTSPGHSSEPNTVPDTVFDSNRLAGRLLGNVFGRWTRCGGWGDLRGQEDRSDQAGDGDDC